jgi:NAD(P) transhydrogenase subunit alpha
MTQAQLAAEAAKLAAQAQLLAVAHPAAAGAPFIFLFAIFVMACFVGYYVVWNVTPALHSPLLAVTNAISSVIVVGAILAAGIGITGWSRGFGFIAVLLASVNIFGGFFITHRMLAMFRRKQG